MLKEKFEQGVKSVHYRSLLYHRHSQFARFLERRFFGYQKQFPVEYHHFQRQLLRHPDFLALMVKLLQITENPFILGHVQFKNPSRGHTPAEDVFTLAVLLRGFLSRIAGVRPSPETQQFLFNTLDELAVSVMNIIVSAKNLDIFKRLTAFLSRFIEIEQLFFQLNGVFQAFLKVLK